MFLTGVTTAEFRSHLAKLERELRCVTYTIAKLKFPATDKLTDGALEIPTHGDTSSGGISSHGIKPVILEYWNLGISAHAFELHGQKLLSCQPYFKLK